MTLPLMYLLLSALYISSVPVLTSIGLIGLENSTFGVKLVPILVSLFAKSSPVWFCAVSVLGPVVKVNEPGVRALPAVSARGAPKVTV